MKTSWMRNTLAAGFALLAAAAAASPPRPLPPPNIAPAPPREEEPEFSPSVRAVHDAGSLRDKQTALGALLEHSAADGSLTQAEYQRAHHELNSIQHQEDQMRRRHRGLLTDTDAFHIEARIETLARSIRWTH
jgi:hypothetical protein